MSRRIVAGVIIAIVALVVGFVPIMDVPYTEIVQYQDTETYYEDEPYEEIETYTGDTENQSGLVYSGTDFSHAKSGG